MRREKNRKKEFGGRLIDNFLSCIPQYGFLRAFLNKSNKVFAKIYTGPAGEHRDYGLYLRGCSDIINIGAVCIKDICKKLDKRLERGAGWFSVLQNLSWLTQLGLSLAAPPVLCLLGAGWLARRFSLGPWVYFAAIVLGLGAAACTFAEFVKMFRRKNGKK